VELNLEAMHAAGMVTVSRERSATAEEFRLIKRPLLVKAFAQGDKKIPHGNLIMVTSARPGDGKTFCSINLAMSIALERDLTVMLIDADVIKPAVANTLGIEAERGLIDWITDDGLNLSDVLLRTNVERLTVLPAGRSDPLATELIASDRMIQLVDEIATRYPDRVIILDSPPVLMNTIPAVLAHHVGQTVFVVQADSSTQAAVDTALGMISACNNISLLLNKARDLGGTDRFGKYGTYYGYER
jgi:exopolysaccharide/PEP-CTERM locus tyrosine autokinase